jgi:hypothetical protein
MSTFKPALAAILAALLLVLPGCNEETSPDDDDTTVSDDDDSSVSDDDDTSVGDDDDSSVSDDDDDTKPDDDDDSSVGDDDDSTEPPVAVRTPAAHQICAAAGKSSADGLTMTTCFGPKGLAQGTSTDGTITLHAGAFRQITP